MKLTLITSKRESQYTVALLKKLALKHKLEWVKPFENPDLYLCSVCDIDDLPKLKLAKKLAGNKPVVMGGMEAFTGNAWLRWADYIWMGEGFEFFELLANQGWGKIINHPAMYHKKKLTATPSRRIDWQDVPLVKTGKSNWYFLAGRGCSGHCPFCFTKWVHKYQVAPKMVLEEASRTIERMTKRDKLHWISNDNMGMPETTRAVNPSVRIKDFLKNPMKYKGATSFHFGIERFSEAGREEWKKPISNEDISKLMSVLKEMRKESEFFFLIGLPSSIEESKEFTSIIPLSADNYPRTFIKLTYFDPSPHTPLARYDLNQLTEFTPYNKFLFSLVGHNKSFRLYPVRGLARAMWRSVFRRCTFEEVERLGNDPGAKQTKEGFVNSLKEKNLGHLLDGNQEHMPWEGINCGNQ